MSNTVTQASQVPASRGDTLLNFIERASRDEAFDLAKFEALLRMQREVVADQAKREFNEAMAHAQAEMEPVIRDAKNTNTNSRYARLETIDAQMRPIYTRHGFSVRYGSEQHQREGWLRIKCTVAHSGGYFEEHHLDAALDASGLAGKTNKTQVQAVGSTVTYLRRYLLSMVFNIVVADEDNDGNAIRGSAAEKVARATDIIDHGRQRDNRFYRQTDEAFRNGAGDSAPNEHAAPEDVPDASALEKGAATWIEEFAKVKGEPRLAILEEGVMRLLEALSEAGLHKLRGDVAKAMSDARKRIVPPVDPVTLEGALPPVASGAGK